MALEEQALIDALRQENQALRTTIATLETQLHDLVEENRAMRDQLDQTRREGARQAAPFRRRDSKIEKAKGILMKKANLDEHDAFRRLQRLASDKNRKLIDIAQMILTAEEAYGGTNPG